MTAKSEAMPQVAAGLFGARPPTDHRAKRSEIVSTAIMPRRNSIPTTAELPPLRAGLAAPAHAEFVRRLGAQRSSQESQPS
jgi:hypothetical protein